MTKAVPNPEGIMIADFRLGFRIYDWGERFGDGGQRQKHGRARYALDRVIEE
jgi:hypothetical protein